MIAALPIKSQLPPVFGRAEEEALLNLCASGSLDVQHWLAAGPRWFVAGVAVMIAHGDGAERQARLRLAEALYPGMSKVEFFGHWLKTSPVKPSRFLPMLDQRLRAQTVGSARIKALEDSVDLRDAKRVMARIKSGKEKTVSAEQVFRRNGLGNQIQ